MSKRVLKLLNFRIKKSFYTKMLVFYSILTIGVLLLSFSLSINVFNKSFEMEIKESNKRLLSQVQIYIDKNLLEKVNSIINERFLDPSSGSSTLDFYSYNNHLGTDSVLNAIRSISNTLVNYDFLDSISLYRKLDDTLLTTDGGIRFNVFSPDIKMPPIPYTDILKGLTDSNGSKLWISPLENKKHFPEMPMISFIQSIPLYSSFQDSNGCIILNINQDLLFKPIYKIYGQDGDLMVIDSDGRLFAHSDPSKLMEKSALEETQKAILQNNEGFITTKLNGKNYGITWVKSTINDWRYVSVVTVENLNKHASAVTRVILTVFCFIILLSFIGLNIITSRLYHPLKAITKKAADNFKFEVKGENDLNYINNALSYLSDKVDDMEETINNNQEVIKYKTVIDILYGNMSKTDDIGNRFKLFNAPFESSLYVIIIAEIDRKVFARLSLEQREFITSKTNDLISLYFSDKCSCISICHPSSCIVAILNFDEQDTILSAFSNLLMYLESELRINFNIFVSELSDQVSSLDRLYSFTRDYLKYSYIYNYKNIFTHTTIDRYESNNGDFDINLLNQMELFLKSCKVDKFKCFLSEQAAMIKTKGYSYNYTQNFLFQTIGVISRVCREQEITLEQLEKSSILNDFNNISSLDECMGWINSIIDLYFENVKKRNVLIDHEFIQKIVAYVSENIEKQISLNNIADAFNISPSHLSRTFKEGLNISFSDFILDKKLEKAAELIVDKDDKNIAEIAEKLGYLTPAYFSKIFKQKYGMSPALYRKKML